MELSVGLTRYCAALMQIVDGSETKDGNKTTINLRGTDALCTYTINSKKNTRADVGTEHQPGLQHRARRRQLRVQLSRLLELTLAKKDAARREREERSGEI